MRIAWGLLLVAGCGGAPFTIGAEAIPIEGAAPAEVEGGLRELKRDAEMVVEAAVDAGEPEATSDARDAAPEATDVKDAAQEATDAQDAAPEARVDAGESSDADMAPDLGFECLPAPPTLCGCGGGTGPSGGNAFTYPAEFCMFPADFSVIVATPAACQCAGHYTCECVSATNPCATTGQKFVSCQVGTTGGVVVTCK